MAEYFTPLTISVAIAGTALVAVWLFHVWTVRACRKELQAFKERVVTLSDKIDALKERHKLLPHLDSDFTVPMSGETLATYAGIAERLEHYRQTWLNLMDAWEQAQELLKSERFLGNKRSRLARRKLRGVKAPEVLAALIADCEAPLNAIEQAHAQAASELELFRKENLQLGSQLELLAAADLSIRPYEPDRTAAASLAERAQAFLPADPLATVRCLGEACAQIVAIRSRASTILKHATAAREQLKTLADIQQMAVLRRSQGFLLQEAGANPDPLLLDVRQRRHALQDALNQANESAAERLLSDASALLEQGRQGLEQHVAAKARCAAEIPVRQAEGRRLADLHARARGQHAELARDFAPETWLGVAENVQRAEASLAAANQCAAEAIRHAADTTQSFVLAAKLLDQAAANQQHAQTELTAIGQRLRELVDLRSAFQSQLGQLRSRSDRISQLLQTSSADRALANERFRAARLMLDRLEQTSRLQRPDWMQLTAHAREIEGDLDAVQRLANEDMQLAQQSSAELAEAEKIIQSARAFQDQGITPDVSAAESQLAQARGCLMTQGYEEAIRLANAAAAMARAAHQDAMSRSQRRQQELESQLRAQQAAAIPGPLMRAEAEIQ